MNRVAIDQTIVHQGETIHLTGQFTTKRGTLQAGTILESSNAYRVGATVWIGA
jgi:hypothetical protein